MFDFSGANDSQKEAIRTTEGPVLIIAGPGTGKTFTLVQRTVYLIEEKHVSPEQILIATYTEKAAGELITRISNELVKRNISVNLNEMYIGTFHSICLRMLKDYGEDSAFQRNPQILDDFTQHYRVMQNISRFNDFDDYTAVINEGSSWQNAKKICDYANRFREELADPEAMSHDEDQRIAAAGKILLTYRDLLEEKKWLDFSSIQTSTYRMITENPEIRDRIQSKIRYVMIDEYQDTNYIQDCLVLELGGRTQNICVVGDDDQGLYRFRGGSVRNILEFPQKFPQGKCAVIPLTVNYRSNSQIVDFYNSWMKDEAEKYFRWKTDEKCFRHDKKITAFRTDKISSPAVIRITGKGRNDWHERILDFILRLKKSGKITDLNQIAFLFFSVRSPEARGLAEFLRSRNIPVYCPRAGQFFARPEVRYALGALLLALPHYKEAELRKTPDEKDGLKYKLYYRECIEKLESEFRRGRFQELKRFIEQEKKRLKNLKEGETVSFSRIFYQLLAFEPFRTALDTDLADGDFTEQRPARNLAGISELLRQFENTQGRSTVEKKWLEHEERILFGVFFRYHYEEKLNEPEDQNEYAPGGHVSFMTFHQSKGMEFPVVVVGSMNRYPRERTDSLAEDIADRYCHRPRFEPINLRKYFDFWRIFYTVFSRAQDLLVLTADRMQMNTPSYELGGVYWHLPEYTAREFHPEAFSFRTIKDSSIKNSYSFTTHITVYRDCPVQYKMLKELQFTPVRQPGALFGKLVHETIEDVHRAALRGEADQITPRNVGKWTWANYLNLHRTEGFFLDRNSVNAADRQVMQYVWRQRGDWSRIRQAEYDVSLIMPDYIIAGTVDLIRGTGDTVELVDFKSEKKEELQNNPKRLERYRKQLLLYAHIIEEKSSLKISRLHLYCTGGDDRNPQISFPATREDIEETVREFDATVRSIERKEFSQMAADKSRCQYCDFRYYCGRA